MGSPFLILAHSFKKESLGRTTTLANSFLPQSELRPKSKWTKHTN